MDDAPPNDTPRSIDITGRISILCALLDSLERASTEQLIIAATQRFTDVVTARAVSLDSAQSESLRDELAAMRERGDPAVRNIQRFFDTMCRGRIGLLYVNAPYDEIRQFVADVVARGLPHRSVHVLPPSWTRSATAALFHDDAAYEKCCRYAAASVLCQRTLESVVLGYSQIVEWLSEHALEEATTWRTSQPDALTFLRDLSSDALLIAAGPLQIIDTSDCGAGARLLRTSLRTRLAFASIPEADLPQC